MASWADTRPDTPQSENGDEEGMHDGRCYTRPPPLPLGNLKPPRAPGRAPLAAVPVPQPTSTPHGRTKHSLEARKNEHADQHASMGLPYEELSTVPPSSVGSYSARSPRQHSARTPSRGSPCSSPRRVTSPRARMNDVLHGQNSIIRYPELQRRNRIPSATKKGVRHTTPLQSPRNLANDAYPRMALEVSNDCVQWLRSCQSDLCVENLVDDMLTETWQETVDGFRARIQGIDPKHIAEYRFARENLRTPSYRNATKCATSMARRTKPPQAWR